MYHQHYAPKKEALEDLVLVQTLQRKSHLLNAWHEKSCNVCWMINMDLAVSARMHLTICPVYFALPTKRSICMTKNICNLMIFLFFNKYMLQQILILHQSLELNNFGWGKLKHSRLKPSKPTESEITWTIWELSCQIQILPSQPC